MLPESIGRLVGAFLISDWCGMTIVGVVTSGQVFLDGIIKQGKQAMRCMPVSNSSMTSVTVPESRFLPWVPSITDYDVEMWDEISPFLPKVAGLYHNSGNINLDNPITYDSFPKHDHWLFFKN